MNTTDYLEVLNPEQLEAVQHEGSPLLILAGAGSGKTRVITTKIAWLIGEKNIQPEKILAVTFTNKAAAEMRERAERMIGTCCKPRHAPHLSLVRRVDIAAPLGVGRLKPEFYDLRR